MINITDYGYAHGMNPECTEGEPARVTAVYRDRFELVSERGYTYGRLKTGAYLGRQEIPTTGDFVLTAPRGVSGESGDDLIIKTLPRQSFFSRREPGPIPKEQAVAANFDYVFLLSSLNQDFNLRRLERYLTQAWQSGGLPIVVLTKADLIDDHAAPVRAVERVAAGAGIFAVSAKTGYGMKALAEVLEPRKTVVLLGSSGVGKSSLLNALAGREVMAEGGIREDDGRGRHTTTHRQLILLDSGVMFIDTPGMRSLGMWDVSTGLGGAFEDVERFFGQCKYSDCKHQSEPGCAVKAALAEGTLSQDRYESYIKLKREARYADDKAAALRDKDERNKAFVRWSRQYKKKGG